MSPRRDIAAAPVEDRPAVSHGMAGDDVSFPYNGMLLRLVSGKRFTADRELRRYIDRNGFAVLWDDEA